MKRLFALVLSVWILIALPGCGIIVVQDDYSLDKIDGDITCEYRIGRDAKWSETCVNSEVTFDKDMFLKLFQAYAQYDPLIGSKDPKQYDVRINPHEQPEVLQRVLESEFNVRAVFGDDQRNVSIYRYDGKLYFHVLTMGDRSEPEEIGYYFIELPEEMRGYWKSIIESVEADVR